MRTKLLLLSVLFHLSIQAQNVTGSWYGNADVMLSGRHNNYLAEMIIKQKGSEVVGILGYYFKNGYQSVYIHGNYDKASRTITIDNIPITYFRAKDIDGVNCYMDFTGTLVVSRVKSNINGYFSSDPKYKYTCPELRVTFDLDADEENKQDSLIKNSVAKRFWQPQQQDVIVENEKPVVKDTPVVAKTNPLVIAKDTADIAKTETPVVANDTPAVVAIIEKEESLKAAKQTVVKTATPVVGPIAIAAAPQVPSENELLIKAFEKRKNTYSHDLVVTSDSVRVSFYDNGEIDGDIISVLLNNQPILVKQELAATALNIYIVLDKTKEINELSMFAENLGKYPPNTALMVLYDGNQRQEVYLSSSLSQNATIRIKRKHN
ncbi:hypothetical protein [Pinibacter soli]|uniref:Uncharacterized protein n=1 Tax=Pinibacter soli TaxID=3044211 RepID=A0ABT6R953_9BACT|nr:hypothetical protein [Pinibacter soli]MDI3319088.1 hypothetical protein [Pinibacter soli]